MNNTQTKQITALKLYLTAKLEEWEKATAGPWISQRTPTDWGFEQQHTVKTPTHDPDEAGYGITLKYGGVNNPCRQDRRGNQSGIDSLCIAESRTLSPLLITNILREIEWLEKKTNMGGMYFANESFYVAYKAVADQCNDRLNEILNLFKQIK